MMEKILSRSIRLMCVGGVAFGMQAAQAQQAPNGDMQRVVVTGSSIKRIAAEGSLPVTIMSADQIRASGVTSAADLVAKLAVVQGSTGESASVGGSTFGFAGISIHNVGETRTLVLLNGKRLAQFGGQTLTGFAAGFDLNSIPLSAIDRVELLTDGASALYGADAIAGVVNFITKHNRTDGDVTVGYSHPKGGGTEKRASVTKGIGNIDEDGYNVMLTYGHDERTELLSGARSFANTGVRSFNLNGKSYRIQQYSASPIPANAIDDQGQLISPYRMKNGSCPVKTFRVIEPYNDGSGLADDYCGYDFVQDLRIYPSRKRDNLMASGTYKLGQHELYTDILLSRSNQYSQIAPVPGQIAIDAGSALHDKYLAPLGITGDSIAYYRLFDLGGRGNSDTAKFGSISVGSRGTVAGWDYNGSYNFSISDVKGNTTGYPGTLAVRRLTSSGLLDPFVGPGQQSADAQKAIAGVNYKGYWDGGTSKLHSLQANGSRELMALQGGALMLGLGANFNREEFASKPSLFAQGALADPVAGTLCGGTSGLKCDQRFGDAASSLPYEAARNSQGVFAELIAPVIKNLELGAAVRYDHYSDFGGSTTGKLSFKWTATPSLMVRGSVGNGFHAPTVPQVAAKLQSYGVTSEKYSCSPAMAQIAGELGATCRPGKLQYDQLAGGNKSLQPEKSRQATLGLRYEPNGMISAGADLWFVGIRDSFGQLSEDVVFADPLRYRKSWGANLDVGTGKNYLAFLADNQNLGKSYATGIDWDITGRYRTPVGPLNSTLRISTMLRERSQLEQNGEYYSAIGNFADLGVVTFRNQGTWNNTLKTGDWATTLTLNFKSGYMDQATTVQVLDAAGEATGQEKVRVPVGYYSTWDLQTVWNPTQKWALTAGVLNLFDRNPPFVPSTSHAGSQQFGYDARYYDARGRTLYLNASYRF
jgi:iron complex outermembrane receptor protein